MKIALFSEGQASIWLNNAIKKCGHEVVNISWNGESPRLYEHLLDSCDFILCMGGQFHIDGELFSQLKIPKVYWFCDTVKRHLGVFKEVCEACDIVLLSQKDSSFIDNKKTFFLPPGYDPEYTWCDAKKISKQDIDKYSCDVSFIGTYNHPRRLDFVGHLEEFSTHIWGNNWPGRVYEQNGQRYFYPYNKQWRGFAIYGEEYAKAILLAKINVDLHYPDDCEPEKFSCVAGPSFKTMEILGVGGFLLTDNVQGISDLFRDGEHLAVYDSYEDMKSKIRYYLDNRERAIEIGINARKEVLAKHLWEYRIKWIGECLNAK